MPAENPRHPVVTVVIPVKDDPEGVRNCIDALLDRDPETPSFEVVIVDNGSSPPLAVFHPDVRVVREAIPGSYAARNAGIRAARGDILAFTDADARPTSDWLLRAVSRITDLGHGPAAIAGHIAVEVSRRRHPFEFYELLHYLDQRSNVAEGFGATANLITTRATLETVGLFDAQLQSGGDVEWGHRLRSCGGNVVFAPEVVVRHPARSTWSDAVERMERVATGRHRLQRRGVLPPTTASPWLRFAPPIRSVARGWRDPRMRDRAPGDRLRMAIGLTGARYLSLVVRRRVRQRVREGG